MNPRIAAWFETVPYTDLRKFVGSVRWRIYAANELVRRRDDCHLDIPTN